MHERAQADREGVTVGATLDGSTRESLSRAFHHDFGDVRVTTDDPSAAAMGAKAYNRGRHVAFGPGQFQPNTPAGLRLLAHELTHVVQRTRTGSGATADVEQEADQVGTQVAAGGAATVRLGSGDPVLHQVHGVTGQPLNDFAGQIASQHVPLQRSVEHTHWGSPAERRRFIRDYLLYCSTHPELRRELAEGAAAYPDVASELGYDTTDASTNTGTAGHRSGPYPMTVRSVPPPTSAATGPDQTSAGDTVSDVAEPVVAVPIADDRKVRELVAAEQSATPAATATASTTTATPARRDQIAGTPSPPADPDTYDFNGLTDVATYARALAVELGRRRQGAKGTQILSARREAARQAARTTAEADVVEGEARPARARRISAAVTAAGTAATGPTPAEAAEAARLEAMAALVASWIRHVHAPSTQAMTVGHLASAWMNNRGQEALFETEAQTRPADQSRLWSNVWITPLPADEHKMESDPTRGVGLGTVPGGTPSGATLIDPRIVPLLTDLHTRIPHVHFGTYGGHGSGGAGCRST